jgi:hypothetical protein
MSRKNKTKWCIVLTTTVNVHDINGLHQKNKEERINTYLTSIRQWLLTDLPIVVVENSGYTFPELKGTRVEVITFHSEKDTEFNHFCSTLLKFKDKGIYELRSIRYACEHSKIIKRCTHIMKVTGRYYIPSLEGILKKLPFKTKAVRQHNSIQCEVLGCRKDYIESIFDYITMNKDNKIIDFIEEVYQHRISKISHVILPSMPISPTKRGGMDEIKTFL